MDRRACFAIIAAIPVLAIAFYFSTRIMTPFWGYGAALAFYWFAVLFPLILWRGGFRKARFAVIWPGRWLAVADIIPLLFGAGGDRESGVLGKRVDLGGWRDL